MRTRLTGWPGFRWLSCEPHGNGNFVGGHPRVCGRIFCCGRWLGGSRRRLLVAMPRPQNGILRLPGKQRECRGVSESSTGGSRRVRCWSGSLAVSDTLSLWCREVLSGRLQKGVFLRGKTFLQPLGHCQTDHAPTGMVPSSLVCEKGGRKLSPVIGRGQHERTAKDYSLCHIHSQINRT